MSELQRRLALEGAVNLRDIGGYRIQDQRETRWQVFLRADNLDKLTAADQQTLLDYGLRHVVDLRSSSEAQHYPDVFARSAAVIYHHLPLIEDGPDMQAVEALPTHFEVYHYFLERCQPALKTILETICATGDGCTVFHCTGGKDRTGVIAALLLGLVAVDAETIAQDYALTSQYLASRAGEWRQQVLDAGGDVERFDRMMATRPEVMRQTLAYLQGHYGGIPEYVQAIGVSDSAVSTLRLRFVGDA